MNLLIVGYLGCFHNLTTVNRVAVNMADQVSVEQDIKSLAHMPRSHIARSHGRFTFSFLGLFTDS